MLLPHFTLGRFLVGLMVTSAGVVSGQTYPNKPIYIVTAAPGGGVDFAARIIAQPLSGSLGQQVVVENRGGASGAIAAARVATAPPDAYTVLFYGNPFWILPFLRDDLPYDPVRDFSPITLAYRSPNVLVVHPSLPVRSVRELIALAKAKPGDLNYATSGSATASHLAAELFNAKAGISMVRVPYKGAGPAFNDLMSGQVQLMFSPAASAMRHVKSGRLSGLAVTSAQSSPLAPGLPTVAASGLPGFESVSMYGIFAPAKSPPARINRLNEEIVRVLNKADVKEKLFNAGAEVVASSSEQLAAAVKSEMAELGKVIKDAGIRAD